MIAASLLLLLAPASAEPGPTTSPVQQDAKKTPGPLPRACTADGTKPKAPSSGQPFPESYGVACELRREVKQMSKTLSDEPVDDMGARGMWEDIDAGKDKSKKERPKPKP